MATFGNTSTGTSYTACGVNYFAGAKLTSPSDYSGRAKTINARVRSSIGTLHAKAAIYRVSDNALVAVSSSARIPASFAWVAFHLPTGPTLSASTDYWVGIISESASIWFDYSSTGSTGVSTEESDNSYATPSSTLSATETNKNYCVNVAYNVSPFIGFGAADDGTSTVIPKIPTGSGAIGDELILLVGGKPYNETNDNSITTVTEGGSFDWDTSFGKTDNGTTDSGIDTGSVVTFSKLALKTANGFLTDDPITDTTITHEASDASVNVGVIARLSKFKDQLWSSYDFWGSDSDETGTSVSCTITTSTLRTGDVVVFMVTTKGNSFTLSSVTLTVPSCTVSLLESSSLATASGQDMTAYWYAYEITSGTSTGSPTVTATSSLSGASGAAIRGYRMRANTPPTVAINSPSDGYSTNDTTPDLVFTGTDIDANDIKYNVQINSVPKFASDSYEAIVGTGVDWGRLYSGSSVTLLGQSFKGSGGALTQVQLKNVKRTGTLTGNCYAVLYAHTGTYGTGGLGTGSVLATSSAVDASTISNLGNGQIVTFTFDGSYTTTYDTPYVIGLIYTGGDVSNYLEWLTIGGSIQTWAGNPSRISSGSWASTSNTDDHGFTIFDMPALTRDAVSGTDNTFTGSPDNTSPYASGQQVTYTPSTALSPGTYYWRVAGIDPSGSDTYGAWSEIRSFTITVGTNSNTTQDVRITGKNTSDVTQNVRATGQNSSSVTQDVRTTGTAVSNVTQDARTTGQLTSSEYQETRITGKASSDVTQNTRVTGQATSSTTQDARITGKAVSAVNQDARTTGTAVSFVNQDTRIFGGLFSSTSQDARITGTPTGTPSSTNQDAKITGSDISSTTLDARIEGSLETSTTQHARLTGSDSSLIEGLARVTGQAQQATSGDVRVSGKASDSTEGLARLTGQAASQAAQDARLLGQDNSSTTQETRITGKETSSTASDSRILGSENTAISVDARISGADSTSVTQEVRLTGALEPVVKLTASSWDVLESITKTVDSAWIVDIFHVVATFDSSWNVTKSPPLLVPRAEFVALVDTSRLTIKIPTHEFVALIDTSRLTIKIPTHEFIAQIRILEIIQITEDQE